MFKRIDRLLNILDVTAGAYIRQVNFAIEQAEKQQQKQSRDNNSKENSNGRYSQSTDQAFGLIDRSSNDSSSGKHCS